MKLETDEIKNHKDYIIYTPIEALFLFIFLIFLIFRLSFDIRWSQLTRLFNVLNSQRFSNQVYISNFHIHKGDFILKALSTPCVFEIKKKKNHK